MNVDLAAVKRGQEAEALDCDGKDADKRFCRGKALFESALAGVSPDNGRACSTCHLESDGLALSPASVQALPPSDPIFNALDADDPNAAELTFDHLERGLVRVKLELPPNVDLIAVPPAHPDPSQSLELAAAFTNTLDADGNVQVGSAEWWWNTLVVKGTHQCEADRTPDEPPVNTAIGEQYEIVTPCDRVIEVWRGVPSVVNTAYTRPFQADGRLPDLVEQARGALLDHSQFDTPDPEDLELIAEYEKSLFSSERAEFVAKKAKSCLKDFTEPSAEQRECLAKIADPERIARLSPTIGMNADEAAQWERGKVLYDQVCAPCHGTATDDRIVNRDLHDGFFVATELDGTVVFLPDGGVQSVERADSEFLNIATSFVRYVGQIVNSALPPGSPGGIQQFASDVSFPKYRLRFYSDATRTVPVTDLPPLPFVDNPTPANPFGAFGLAFDPRRGKPATGPNFANQLYTTDPGRALISGDPAEFEGFDVPQLRGLANTAPYFHDNQAETLRDVLDFYSVNVFPFIAQFIGLPPQNPPVPGTEMLSGEDKDDLEFFLETF